MTHAQKERIILTCVYMTLVLFISVVIINVSSAKSYRDADRTLPEELTVDIYNKQQQMQVELKSLQENIEALQQDIEGIEDKALENQ